MKRNNCPEFHDSFNDSITPLFMNINENYIVFIEFYLL